MVKRKFKSGEIVPESGQATLYNSKGKSQRTQRTVVEGEKFPPTPKKGWRNRITDKTKHKA